MSFVLSKASLLFPVGPICVLVSELLATSGEQTSSSVVLFLVSGTECTVRNSVQTTGHRLQTTDNTVTDKVKSTLYTLYRVFWSAVKLGEYIVSYQFALRFASCITQTMDTRIRILHCSLPEPRWSLETDLILEYGYTTYSRTGHTSTESPLTYGGLWVLVARITLNFLLCARKQRVPL